ncbi:MAG TPA: 30S ribosome-binding factor RbfA [Cycloclasticus sp.]|jgi:ribosome-binding factor A|nr:30S ribosome-binding factor RbfA [Cycloclasticus sp.]HIL92632.1 30S ribosome-binding factor RbfA [Cycloclasticus sp.]
MAREFLRFQRVERQLQRELAEILQRDIRDPEVGFVTVSGVEVTKDIAIAKVFISVLTTKDDENKQSSIAALNRASNYIHGMVSKRMRMRMVPELRFFLDESIEQGIKMDALLKATNPDNEK